MNWKRLRRADAVEDIYLLFPPLFGDDLVSFRRFWKLYERWRLCFLKTISLRYFYSFIYLLSLLSFLLFNFFFVFLGDYESAEGFSNMYRKRDGAGARYKTFLKISILHPLCCMFCTFLSSFSAKQLPYDYNPSNWELISVASYWRDIKTPVFMKECCARLLYCRDYLCANEVGENLSSFTNGYEEQLTST